MSLCAQILKITLTYINILMDCILFEHVNYVLATNRIDAT